MVQKNEKSMRSVQHAALGVTRWVGSPTSIIAHTVFFAACFVAAYINLISFDRMLLVLTTVVSLEAIYLAIFIQISINSANEAIEEIEKDVDEIQEDVDEIQEDVEGIEKDVDELQEDVEDMTEEEKKEAQAEKEERATLSEIQKNLHKLMQDIESLQHKS
jgi:uncharacterized protein YoxC